MVLPSIGLGILKTNAGTDCIIFVKIEKKHSNCKCKIEVRYNVTKYEMVQEV